MHCGDYKYNTKNSKSYVFFMWWFGHAHNIVREPKINMQLARGMLCI